MNRRQLLRVSAVSSAAVLTSGCTDEFSTHIDPALPHGPFGAASTAEEVSEGIDLRGKVALVTGCTSGLGYETMRVLALRGAHVIGTGRTLEKARVACTSVGGKTTPLALELSDFGNVIECAEAVAALGMPLDILICNAGINTFGDLELVNGIEKMFVVNFLGHFVLVNRLLARVQAASQGRIVHVGSRSGYRSAPRVGIDFDNLRGEKTFDARQSYGRSKLANALFSLELARRLKGSTTTSNAIHPGLVTTNIGRTAPAALRFAFEVLGPLFAKNEQQGAATQVYVATYPALGEVSGAWFEDCNPVIIEGPHHVFDAPMAERLWRAAEQMTSPYLRT